MSSYLSSGKFAKIGFIEQDGTVYTGQKKVMGLVFTNNFPNASTYTVNGSPSAPTVADEGTTYNLVYTETSTGFVSTDSITIPISETIIINRTKINASGGLANGSYIVHSISGTRSQNIIEISYLNLTTLRYYKDGTKLKSGNYNINIVTDLGENVGENINI